MQAVPRALASAGSSAERAGDALATAIRRHVGQGGPTAAFPPLALYRRDEPTPRSNYWYASSVSVIAQGAKRVVVGERQYDYGPCQLLVTSVDMPTMTQVTQASREQPYLSALLTIDHSKLADLVLQERLPHVPPQPAGLAMAVSDADEPLLDAFRRLVALLDTPQHIPTLGPLIEREILYRLLAGDHGQRLRQTVTSGSQGHGIALAIERLKQDFAQPLRVADLACAVHMSTSSFHHHFRLLTNMSPLQFQKRLRLYEARRLMLAEHHDAGYAAFCVGYGSATQFSREYARLFGLPPARDIARLLAPAPLRSV